ncbi:hypothetical protein [Streptomyces sp. NPDC102437]|uniref:hypothetical protein n=1 Tax=Streptomyces sp. NPDC102437 TaxID=3366175 RepID=UPI0037FBA0D9
MSRAGDFFRSLVPGDDVALAAQLRQSAQEREREKEAKKKAKREEGSRRRARAHKRNLPRLG